MVKIEYLGQMIDKKQYLGVVKLKERCSICGCNRFMHFVLDGYFDIYECEECRWRK